MQPKFIHRTPRGSTKMNQKHNHPALPHHISTLSQSNQRAASQVSRQLPILLAGVSSNKIHQRRGQGIVSLQAERLELRANFVHSVRVEALLNDRGHETSELRLLPSLLIGKLGVDKVQSLEGVVNLNAAEQMSAAFLAGVALNGGCLVENLELVCVGSHGEVLLGDYTNDGEESTGGLPALRTSAGVVVGDVALDGDCDFVLRAETVEVSAGKIGVTFGDTVVNEGVEGDRHVDF